MRNSTPARPRPVHYLEKTRPPRSSGAKAIRFAGLTALFACLAGGVIAAGLAMLIWLADRTPREWVPALRQAAVDLPEPLASASDDVAAMLLHLDRMGLADASPLPTRIGAQTERATPLKGGHVRGRGDRGGADGSAR